jgi:hypothetical protein
MKAMCIAVISVLLVLCFCTGSSNPASGSDEAKKISVIINFQAIPPTGFPEQCFVSADDVLIKAFLRHGVDTLSVRNCATLRAEYYREHMAWESIVRDTIASPGMKWEIR